ncbi:MAG TPA: cell division protein FtsX, partial [Clostridiaceae bacterium]|nr:cell division protein FtsX [Clostridiaceae bacterium]
PKNIVHFRSMDYITIQKGASFTNADSDSYSVSKAAYVFFITLDDYNRMENKSESLSNGEALLYTYTGDVPGNTLDFNGLKLSIKKRLPSFNSKGIISSVANKCYYIVVDNANTIKHVDDSLAGKRDGLGELSYYYGFDVDISRSAQIELVSSLNKAVK